MKIFSFSYFNYIISLIFISYLNINITEKKLFDFTFPLKDFYKVERDNKLLFVR